MSINGPDFYGLEVNQDNIELEKTSWMVPDSLDYADDQLIPFMAGKTLSWKLLD